jgi:hypothetical protein
MIGSGSRWAVDTANHRRDDPANLPHVRPRVLTTAELYAELGQRQARAALKVGDWRPVLRGTYTDARGEIDLALRARAARLVLPRGCVVADRCLLWLFGVDVLPPGPPALEVVVERGTVVPRRVGLKGRQAAIPAGDRRELRGVRTLRLARATVDMMRRLPLPEGVVVADAVQHADLLTADQIAAEFPAHARLRGIRTAQRVLDLSCALAESPPESRLRVNLVLGGLDPIPQYDVRGADGRWLARVDLAFPSARVAIEYDGRVVHSQLDVFNRDRQRRNALVGAGWVVLRYTAEDLRLRPHEIVAEVRRAVLAAAA